MGYIPYKKLMNYYIDFDNTLYETAKLTKLMIESIAREIVENSNLKFDEVFEDVNNNFNSTYGNIFEYGKSVASKYNIDVNKVIENINYVIANGEKIVFEDAKRFLERLKDKNHNIIILTYVAKENQEYQLKKILGSGLANYTDEIIITTDLKYTLDIDYKNGVFIDDDPRDLNGLFEKNPIKVIRIRKPSNKRSAKEIENKNIEEYVSFDDILTIWYENVKNRKNVLTNLSTRSIIVKHEIKRWSRMWLHYK